MSQIEYYMTSNITEKVVKVCLHIVINKKFLSVLIMMIASY